MKIEKDVEKERERERDPKTLALIRGYKVRFFMRSKEVVIGRGSPGVTVDINVLDEVNEAPHVSRRQAVIKLKHDGSFAIKNIGLCTIFVNAHPLKSGEKFKLSDCCLIEIEQVKFIFEINRLVWNRIKKHLATAKKIQEKQAHQKAQQQSLPSTIPQSYANGGSSSTSPALNQPVPQKPDGTQNK